MFIKNAGVLSPQPIQNPSLNYGEMFLSLTCCTPDRLVEARTRLLVVRTYHKRRDPAVARDLYILRYGH